MMGQSFNTNELIRVDSKIERAAFKLYMETPLAPEISASSHAALTHYLPVVGGILWGGTALNKTTLHRFCSGKLGNERLNTFKGTKINALMEIGVLEVFSRGKGQAVGGTKRDAMVRLTEQFNVRYTDYRCTIAHHREKWHTNCSSPNSSGPFSLSKLPDQFIKERLTATRPIYEEMHARAIYEVKAESA